MFVVPESHRDLLERPLIGHVATMLPNGRIQSNPVWYVWDGTHLRMTTTADRQKAKNVVADPRMSISVHDPEQIYRYLELRGQVVAVEPDPTGAFFVTLAERYNLDVPEIPGRDRRVTLVFEPEESSSQ